MSTFNAVTWAPNELITEDKMDALNANSQWLFDNTPRAEYTNSNIKRDTGIKIASGVIPFGAQKGDHATGTVRFNGVFSAGCNPIVTTGVVSLGIRNVFCTVNGIGTLDIDYRGFTVLINVAADLEKNDVLSSTVKVNWLAMGY